MNVLHLAPSFHPAAVYGGPIRAGYDLTRALARAGCQVRVLTTNANGRDVLRVAREDVVLEDGVVVRYCGRQLRAAVSLPLLGRLRPYVQWADVVHLMAAYSFPTIPALLTARLLGRPVVWSPRGALQRWHGSRRLRVKAAWEGVCRLVAPRRLLLHATSDEEAASCAARFPGVRCAVVPNGVDIPEAIEPLPGDGTLRLLFLGRLDPIKGLENLVAACRLLEGPAAPPWSLTVAGSGSPAYRERLVALVRELSLTRRVSFVGEVDQAAKARALAAADVLVLPSHRESFGIVVAEALAHGVPVIAGRGTPWSRLEAEGCGLWVDNSAAALAAAIQSIRDMPRPEMGGRGRAWMQREFGWDGIARATIAHYRALVGSAWAEAPVVRSSAS